jgi:hypothetical protein
MILTSLNKYDPIYGISDGHTIRNEYSKITKLSDDKIEVNYGKVVVYKPRRTRVNYGEGEISSTSSQRLSKSLASLDSNFEERRVSIPVNAKQFDLTESCGVYVKIDFETSSGAETLIDIGYEDGSKDQTIIPYIYGLLSKKHYDFTLATSFEYEIHKTTPEDYDDESLGAGGYSGYFYIKIADIELEEGVFIVKQRHYGPIDISEPQIYFGAYELTEL